QTTPLSLHDALPIFGEERLPHDALRIGDPALFRFRVAAGCSALFQHRPIGGFQAPIDLLQFAFAFHLDTEMLYALVGVAGGDGRSEEHTSELQSREN